MSIQQLLLILKARKLLILSMFVLVSLTSLVVSLFIPKSYTARTALVVDVKSADPILGAFIPTQMASGYMATQVDIIRSDRVAQRVVTLTGLSAVPEAREQWLAATGGVGEIEPWLGSALSKKLDVSPSRESSVINIGFSGEDPAFVAAMANAFAQAYIDTTLELKVEPARRYAQWFDERTKGLRENLELAQNRLSSYEQENGIIAADGRLDTEAARLAELSSQLVMVQGQRADSQSRQGQAASAESMPEVSQNPLISGIKSDISRREAERGQLAARLGPNHPELAKLDAELNALRQRVATEIRRVASSLGTNLRISAAREDEIAAAVEAQRARVLELKSHRDQIAVLQRDVDSAQRAYDLVAQRLAQSNLESQTQQTNVAVLTPATQPLLPAGPRKLIIIALGMLVGAILGVGAALLLELRDPRLRGTDDLTEIPGLPFLGGIPDCGGASSKHGFAV
tara:strand:+ start:26068 stop:27441 length:1374 start_codon:yes stop_codon:yes gene_type:complete